MPDTPSVSASWANLMSVSVIASRAPRATGAGAMPVLTDGVTLDAPPRFHGIAPARSDLQEVRAVSLVEAQRRLRQARWRAIHAREVTPHRVRHAVDGLSIDRGEN